jgi:hypothetical protein
VKATWQTRIAFWAAICASCLWLVLTIAIGFAGIRQFTAHGFGPNGRGSIEILIILAVTLQPPIILFLIVRAIRSRNTGRPIWIVARALYPMVSAVLVIGWFGAIQYLFYQSELRMIERWRTGSIAYDCSTYSPTADYNPKTIGPTQLRLTEFRHPGKLSTVIFMWPGKKPIEAVSFQARTGSYGGSQGIAWREPDGRHMIAYLSFSDIMNEYGSASIWVALAQGDTALKVINPDTLPSTTFTCGPDPSSYHE